MDLRDILTKDVATVKPETQLLDAAKLMVRKNISSLVVVEDDVLTGILTERDFVRILAGRRPPAKLKVCDKMSTSVITVDIHTSLEDALNIMHDKAIRRLIVTENGHLSGIITQTDLMNAMRTTKLNVKVTREDKLVDSPMAYDLQNGKTYLFLGAKPEKSFEAFVEIVKHGTAGLMITRQKPEEVTKKWGLEKTPVIWLTNIGQHSSFLDPHDIQGISILLGNYLNEAEKPAIILDGISYLITQNKFDTVLNLIQNIRDKTLKSEAILILTLNPQTLKNQELELIKQEADSIL
jgi:CBS domain-containing protein